MTDHWAFQKKEQTVDEEIADPELEWEHEQGQFDRSNVWRIDQVALLGIERSPSTHRQMISEEILRFFSTDTSPSSIDLDEFEWDDFFDLVL